MPTAKHMAVICYVDDLLFFAKNKSTPDELKVKLNTKLVSKDLKVSKQFLKIKLKSAVPGTIQLNQEAFIVKLLNKTKMSN